MDSLGSPWERNAASYHEFYWGILDDDKSYQEVSLRWNYCFWKPKLRYPEVPEVKIHEVISFYGESSVLVHGGVGLYENVVRARERECGSCTGSENRQVPLRCREMKKDAREWEQRQKIIFFSCISAREPLGFDFGNKESNLGLC